MANITITNEDLAGIQMGDNVFRDELLTFAGAGTVKAGTILARDSASLKMVPFVKGGVTNENGIPKAVVVTEVTAAAAGDIAIRSMISGKVRLDKLVIDADGDASNIDAAVIDQMRDFTIIARNVDEVNVLDNQ